MITEEKARVLYFAMSPMSIISKNIRVISQLKSNSNVIMIRCLFSLYFADGVSALTPNNDQQQQQCVLLAFEVCIPCTMIFLLQVPCVPYVLFSDANISYAIR